MRCPQPPAAVAVAIAIAEGDGGRKRTFALGCRRRNVKLGTKFLERTVRGLGRFGCLWREGGRCWKSAVHPVHPLHVLERLPYLFYLVGHYIRFCTHGNWNTCRRLLRQGRIIDIFLWWDRTWLIRGARGRGDRLGLVFVLFLLGCFVRILFLVGSVGLFRRR